MENGEKEKDCKAEKNDDGVRGEEERSNGIINQIFSNLVSGGREENQGSGDNKESEGEVMGGEEEEKEGGGLIRKGTTLVSPLSPKGSNERKVEDFEAEDERTNGGGGGEIVNNVKTEEEDGGGGGGGGGGEGIIDKLVSHLPTGLTDDVDPATDEASILIHSIVHD